MPKLSSERLPKCRHHKASGQAIVTLSGQDFYLGPWKSKVAAVEYDRLTGEWLAAGRQLPKTLEEESPTIVEVLARYWVFAERHYQAKDGRPSKELDNIRYAVRPLKRLYGYSLVRDFGPLALKALQQSMIQDDLCRPVVNSRIGKIKRVFRWAVSEQLCPPAVLQGLNSVMGLQRGRTEAREPAPVEAIDDATVNATIAHLPAVVADMVRFQKLAGCRPGEVCSLRPCDVDRSEPIWVYRPAHHKMQHTGRERLIFIGPRAQKVLRPYLSEDEKAFCFSPAESEEKRKTSMRANRRSKVQPSQIDRRKKHPKAKPGERYSKDAYCRAIQRGCDKAFPAPEGQDDEEKAVWRKDHRWSPNQLRHAAATAIRQRFGLEAAQVVLGHSRADVTQVYAARDQGLAARIMGEVG
jgi:integrase